MTTPLAAPARRAAGDPGASRRRVHRVPADIERIPSSSRAGSDRDALRKARAVKGERCSVDTEVLYGDSRPPADEGVGPSAPAPPVRPTHEVWSGIARLAGGAEHAAHSRSALPPARGADCAGTRERRVRDRAAASDRAAARRSSRRSKATSGTWWGCRSPSSCGWPPIWRAERGEARLAAPTEGRCTLVYLAARGPAPDVHPSRFAEGHASTG